MSRFQCSIRGDFDADYIFDLKSKNGTYVNGKRLGESGRRLRNMDRIEVGDENVDVHWVFMESRKTVVMRAKSKR